MVNLGAPAAVSGTVEGVAEGISALSKLLLGRLAHGRSTRPFIALGYGLAAVRKVLLAVAGAWPVVLAGRGVDRIGNGIRSAPRDALLMVDVPGLSEAPFSGSTAQPTPPAPSRDPYFGLGLYELLDHRLRPLLAIAVIPAAPYG